MAVTHFDFRFYLSPPISRDESARVLRRTIDEAGARLGQPLEPLEHARERWELSLPEIFSGAGTLRHRDLADRSGDPFWSLAFHYMDLREHAGVSAIQGNIPVAPYDPAGKSLSWEWLVDALPWMVRAAEPDLCLVGASGDSDRYSSNEILPSGPGVVPGSFPSVFTPWAYIGPNRLRPETRENLPDCQPS